MIELMQIQGLATSYCRTVQFTISYRTSFVDTSFVIHMPTEEDHILCLFICIEKASHTMQFRESASKTAHNNYNRPHYSMQIIRMCDRSHTMQFRESAS